MGGKTQAPWGTRGVTIPFTVAAHYGLFTAYNIAVWPMQPLLLLLGVLAMVLQIRQRSYSSIAISYGFTISWLWHLYWCHTARQTRACLCFPYCHYTPNGVLTFWSWD